MRFSHILQMATAVALLLATGCISPEPNTADPVNTANYLLNTLESRSASALPEVMEAFDETLEALGFVRTDLDREGDDAVLTYRGEDDLGITVKLKRFTDYTNIKIRYGLTGHEHQSRRILSGVVERLPRS